jgi:hypothetical protein
MRANLRYFRRRAEAAGRVSFETTTTDTLPEFLDRTPAGTSWNSRACSPIQRSAGSIAPPRRSCCGSTRCDWTNGSSR